jgi:hypothetical protein
MTISRISESGLGQKALGSVAFWIGLGGGKDGV